MERAYNIKVNGKVVRTVGGKKAGRFATTTPAKTRKPLRKRHNRKQRHILAPLIPILWFFLIATGCTGIAELNEMSNKPLTAEPMKAEVAEASGSFESADIPAEYVEEDLFDKYFKENAKTMRAICKAESNLNPNAIGDTNTKYISVGLCQIRLLPERGLTKEQMMIPEENVKYSKHLFDKYGFKPWTCYNNNRYLDYLK